MRKCIRRQAEMVEDLEVKVEGGAYGIKNLYSQTLKAAWPGLFPSCYVKKS